MTALRARVRAAVTGDTARLVAWITGLCVAALICLAFGDALYALTFQGAHP